MLGSAFCYRGIDLSTSVLSGVVDQEQTTDSSNWITSTRPGGHGQQVTFGPNPSEVTGFRLKVAEVGFPVGVMRVAVYAADGGNKPTGTALVFSPYYAMESATVGAYTDYYFPLSGWTPAANTAYMFLLEFFDYFKESLQDVRTKYIATDEYSGGATVASPSYTSEELGPAAAYTVYPTFDLNFTVYSVLGSAAGGPGSLINAGLVNAGLVNSGLGS